LLLHSTYIIVPKGPPLLALGCLHKNSAHLSQHISTSVIIKENNAGNSSSTVSRRNKAWLFERGFCRTGMGIPFSPPPPLPRRPSRPVPRARPPRPRLPAQHPFFVSTTGTVIIAPPFYLQRRSARWSRHTPSPRTGNVQLSYSILLAQSCQGPAPPCPRMPA
jgi:hypothetical protein